MAEPNADHAWSIAAFAESTAGWRAVVAFVHAAFTAVSRAEFAESSALSSVVSAAWTAEL
jgi:hypothetical protein